MLRFSSARQHVLPLHQTCSSRHGPAPDGLRRSAFMRTFLATSKRAGGWHRWNLFEWDFRARTRTRARARARARARTRARARARSRTRARTRINRIDYEHEYHFIEHEHEFRASQLSVGVFDARRRAFV